MSSQLRNSAFWIKLFSVLQILSTVGFLQIAMRAAQKVSEGSNYFVIANLMICLFLVVLNFFAGWYLLEKKFSGLMLSFINLIAQSFALNFSFFHAVYSGFAKFWVSLDYKTGNLGFDFGIFKNEFGFGLTPGDADLPTISFSPIAFFFALYLLSLMRSGEDNSRTLSAD